MGFPSDLDIAQAATLQPLTDIAAQMGIGKHLIEPYGDSLAKIKLAAIEELADRPKAKYVLVSAQERGDTLWALPASGGAPVKLDLRMNSMMTLDVSPDGRHLISYAVQQRPEFWVVKNPIATSKLAPGTGCMLPWRRTKCIVRPDSLASMLVRSGEAA